MAEMDTSSGGGHKKGPGVKKGKKLSTKVDLTPMVDLGFLLITFFIFTTTMSQPTDFKLYLPKDTDDPNKQTKTAENGALTIMLGKDNHVFYYEGQIDGSNASAKFKSANFGTGDDGIRTVILKKKLSTPKEDFMVILKPNKESTYKNVVDILDEMSINVVSRYALVEISETENQLIDITEKANPTPAK